MTSHAAVVARGMGRPCIVGAENLVIDYSKKIISSKEKTLEEGDLISIDGSAGEIYIGELELEAATLSEEFSTLMNWCNEIKKLEIRANAETVVDTSKALEFESN